MTVRNFAVVDRPNHRKTAYPAGTSHWRLYRPDDVATKLGVSTEAADVALQETGFWKAVRIREELIAWKQRLINEERAIQREYDELKKRRQQLAQRRAAVREQLTNVRNLLRIPRAPTNDEAAS